MQDRQSATATTGAADRGAVLYRKCAICHTTREDSGHRAGPTLLGLFGRRAGTIDDYPYSRALRGSGIVWNAETVGRLFDVGPDRMVPGTKMPLQRIPNPADRAALVKHLRKITRRRASGP